MTENNIPQHILNALNDLDTVPDETVEKITELAEKAAEQYRLALCLTDEEVKEVGAASFEDDLKVGIEETKASEYGPYLTDKGALLATIGQDVSQMVQYLGVARVMAFTFEDDDEDLFNEEAAEQSIAYAREIRNLYPESSWVQS